MARSQLKMCIVNPVLVADIAPLVGTQAEIMRRTGISWNSWIKICAGFPIRLSVGRRFRDWVLGVAHDIEPFRARFPDPVSRSVNRKALKTVFLLAPNVSGEVVQTIPKLRSVERAFRMRGLPPIAGPYA